jgi:FkbM family methyltransferase
MNKIAKWIKKILWVLFPKIYDLYHRKVSYSLFGEDIVLKTFLGKKKGFYVDVGAHHPFMISNTAYFYKRGWHGINIEPSPNLIQPFKRSRSRDINLNIGITNQDAELTFYVFDREVFNSFNKEASLSKGKIVRELKIRTYKLADVLDKYLPVNQKIDFFSIDVEGLDLEVLKSNNWEKYVPDYIIVEENDISVENIQKSAIYRYLTGLSYKLIAVLCASFVYQRIR